MTAIPLDPPRGRVSMRAFRWLVRKELWDHLHGYRFYLGASMVFVLCMLATVVRLRRNATTTTVKRSRRDIMGSLTNHLPLDAR